MAVSQEQFQQLADQVRAQEETIATLRPKLDEAGKRVLGVRLLGDISDPPQLPATLVAFAFRFALALALLFAFAAAFALPPTAATLA